MSETRKFSDCVCRNITHLLVKVFHLRFAVDICTLSSPSENNTYVRKYVRFNFKYRNWELRGISCASDDFFVMCCDLTENHVRIYSMFKMKNFILKLEIYHDIWSIVSISRKTALSEIRTYCIFA